MKEEVYERLFEALTSPNELDLPKAAYEIMGMPIVVTDAAFIVVSKYPEEVFGDEQWDANHVGLQIDTKYISIFLHDFPLSYPESCQPIYTNWGYFAKSPRISCAIAISGSVVGYIAALATKVEHEPWQDKALSIISMAFALSWKRSGKQNKATGYSPELFLQGLLTETFNSQESFNRAKILSGIQTSSGHGYILLAMKPCDPMQKSIESYIISRLNADFDTIALAAQDETLYALLCNIHEKFYETQQFDRLAKTIKSFQINCGASRYFNNLYPFEPIRWQADAALLTGIKSGCSEGIFYYDAYFVDVILNTLLDNANMDAYISNSVRTIEEYDSTHNTEYLKTLGTFLRNLGDVSKTIDELHIHRNTLRYRLEKGKEIAEKQCFSTADLLSLALLEANLDRKTCHKEGN